MNGWDHNVQRHRFHPFFQGLIDECLAHPTVVSRLAHEARRNHPLRDPDDLRQVACVAVLDWCNDPTVIDRATKEPKYIECHYYVSNQIRTYARQQRLCNGGSSDE